MYSMLVLDQKFFPVNSDNSSLEPYTQEFIQKVYESIEPIITETMNTDINNKKTTWEGPWY